mgnify:FL=1
MSFHIFTKFGKVFAVAAMFSTWMPLMRKPIIAANVAMR